MSWDSGCAVLSLSLSVCEQPVLICPQSYYRLGVALQGLGRYEDAMVAFAEGLAIDPKSGPLLSGAVQTMLLSPLKGVCVCCNSV